MKTCPVCRGSGLNQGFACGPNAPGYFEVTCLVCHGLVNVPAALVDAFEEADAVARARREERLTTGLSAMEAARARGSAPLAYSRWERNAEAVEAARVAIGEWAKGVRADATG